MRIRALPHFTKGMALVVQRARLSRGCILHDVDMVNEVRFVQFMKLFDGVVFHVIEDGGGIFVRFLKLQFVFLLVMRNMLRSFAMLAHMNNQCLNESFRLFCGESWVIC